jgi:hypothetical protein
MINELTINLYKNMINELTINLYKNTILYNAMFSN